MNLVQAWGSLLKDRGYGAEPSPPSWFFCPGLGPGAPGWQRLLWFECKMASTGLYIEIFPWSWWCFLGNLRVFWEMWPP